MPKTIEGWRIAGEWGGSGLLSHDDHGRISFGDRGVDVISPCRIDLTHMAHGMDDSAEKAIPCFKAAADLIDDHLKQGRAATIHCGHGRSRTAFALIVFLMRHHAFSYKDASELVSVGIVERGVNFDLARKSAQVDQGYQDWVGDARDDIVNTVGAEDRSSLRAHHVATEVRKTTNKVFLAVLQNRSVPSLAASSSSSSSSSSSVADDDPPPHVVRSRRNSMDMAVDEGKDWLTRGGYYQ